MLCTKILNHMNKLTVIEVGKEDVPNLLGLDYVAFQIAAPGAMGHHGGVFFITSYKDIYRTCYLEPSPYTGCAKVMPMEDLEKIFPFLPINPDQWPEGWHYEYLGMGNDLLIREDLWDSFTKEAESLKQQYPDKTLYNLWVGAILDIL